MNVFRGVHGRRQRQRDAEDGTAARVLVDVNPAAVLFDGPFRDGQTETGSTVLAGARFVEPEEPVENPLAVGSHYARALVRDLDDRVIAVVLQIKDVTDTMNFGNQIRFTEWHAKARAQSPRPES